jgi:hypothetical protein
MKDASDFDARPLIARFPRTGSWKQEHPYKTLLGFDEVAVGQALPIRPSAAPLDLSARPPGRLSLCEFWLWMAGDLTRLITL